MFTNNPADLQSAAKNFSILFDSMDTAYMIIDNDFKLLYFNEMATRWFEKYQQIDINVHADFLPFAKPDRKARLTTALQKALNGETIKYETKYDNGEAYWFVTTMFAIRDKSGAVLGICIYIGDITERKNTEIALRISHERYDYVSKVTSDAIWDWDVIANTLYWNETYTSLFGYEKVTEKNNIGSWEQKIHPEDRDRVIENIQSVLKERSIDFWQDEYRYLKKDGSIAYVLDRGHIILNEDGIPVRMVGAMEDITQRKLYEIEREQITREVIQRNKDLEQFAFIVSHNLRSHIANILGLSELLNSDLIADDDKMNIFDALHISSKKLDIVIKDLSYILQVKRDVNEKKEAVKLAELIADIKANLSKDLILLGAEIITDFSVVDTLQSVKTYLYSIMYNLISNSLKYGRAGVPPQIKIRTEYSDEQIVLFYEDNGSGIDLATHGPYLFGLYKRFHQQGEGKGMGLFMVKTQVEALGGSIEVESAVNEGIRFTIRFRN